MHQKDLNLRLVLCPTREPDKNHIDTYNKIYNCWHEVWSQTYTELNCNESGSEMKSDAFTRQDFAAALFHHDECVALILFRHVDISLLANQRDSYFKQWSEIHLKAVTRFGNNLLICGNLGVSPKFRKNTLGISLKELLIGIVMEITLESSSDVLIATPRTDKNVNGPGYDWGATPIALDVDWGHGVRTDLVAVRKKTVLAKRREQALSSLMSDLWRDKDVIEEAPFEKIQVFKSKKLDQNKKAA